MLTLASKAKHGQQIHHDPLTRTAFIREPGLCGLVTSDLIDERFCFGLLIDVGAQLDQALGQRGVPVLAGLFQHAVVQL